MATSRADPKMYSKKAKFMLRFNIHGLLLLDNGPKTCKMKKQDFADIILKQAKRAVIAITGKSGIESMVIHLGD
jgi:hypothetical protein